jgi:hypothetical protein
MPSVSHLIPFLTRALVTVACLATAPLGARAAVITTTYGNRMGSTVEYQNVREASSAGPLFGAPTLVTDDTLVFSPTNFISQPDLPSLSEIIDSQARFTVVAKPGEFIPQLLFEESGIVTLSGDLNATAMASVGAAIFYHIREIDGVAVDGPSAKLNMPIGPSGGLFSIASNGLLNNVAWSGSNLIDFDQIILADPNFAGRATKIEITFDNTLATMNFGESLARIKKNEVRISVPEAGSSLLCLSAASLAGCLWWGKRRVRYQEV